MKKIFGIFCASLAAYGIALAAAQDTSALLRNYKPVTAERLLKPDDWRLADDSPHVRRVGLQPAQSDQHRQRQQAAAGLDDRHGRDARPRVGARRQQRRDVRDHAEQSGDRARREDRRHVCGATSDRERRARWCRTIRAAASRSTATRCITPPARPWWWRSMRKTGQEVWTTTVADNKSGYYISLAPLVADGKVMVGASGGESGIRGFVAALDPDTGKELWRTFTVPAPGEPGQRNLAEAATNGRHGGAPMWVTGNYDPETNLRTGAPATAGPGWATSVPATICIRRRRSRSTSPPARSRATFNTTRTTRGIGTRFRRRFWSTTNATAEPSKG